MAEIIRCLHISEIAQAVTRAFIQANKVLPPDIRHALEISASEETSPLCRDVLLRLRENLSAAEEMDLPICQDTGTATVFAEIGRCVHITGGTLQEAVDEGVRMAYLKGKLRCSVVRDPLYDRSNTDDNTPAFLHVRQVEGDRLRLVCMPKGFGSENMSCMTMLSPSAGEEDIIGYVCDAVRRAGGRPCPPLVLGIGIGGTFDTVAEMAKHSLTAPIDRPNDDPLYAALAERILCAVNETGVGAQGFGGNVTALGVSIETAPTHIAGLPVAVCFCCHAARRAELLL